MDDKLSFTSGEKVLAFFFIFALSIVVCSVITVNTPFWGYMNHRVASNEVGVELVRGEFKRVLPPGVYTNMTLFADMKDVDVSAIPFSVTDPEVLTSDQQRIGLTVSGTVTRPGLRNVNLLTEENWRQYQVLYTDDNRLTERVSALSQQAMKVCVGDRTFEESAIGATRDDLRVCIQAQVSAYAEPYYLVIENVIVPEIIISPEVQAQLDQITASRNNRLLEQANADLAEAQAETDLAEAQGEIRVQQGIVQETERQQAITAELERQRLEAEQSVIEAQANNDIARAEYNIELAQLRLSEAELNANVELAEEIRLAELMGVSPEYARYLIIVSQSEAISEIDFAYVPVGTELFFMFDNDEIVPTFDVND